MAVTTHWHKFDVCPKCFAQCGMPCVNLDSGTSKVKIHDHRPRLNIHDGMCLATTPYRGFMLMCTLARSHRRKGGDHTNGERKWPMLAGASL